ncbi:MAG: mechanosensitive ion channel [Burkholderiaceae bacterium]|nr:mechanosensitive ion channel [Burkholderiaceae bacterium]
MNMSAFVTALQSSLGAHIPQILGAVAILALGWLLAVGARAAIRQLLNILQVNSRIEESTGARLDAESPVAGGAFWLVLLATLIAVLNALDLPLLTNPFAALMSDVVGYLPNLVAGAVLCLVAWLMASVLRALAVRALDATNIDEKLSSEAGMTPMSQNAGNVLFWLVILMFLPAVLNAFRLNGLLQPVTAMVSKLLDMVPNGFAALLIAGVGYLVAKVLRGLVVNLLSAAGADRLNQRVGLDASVRLSSLAGTLAFIFVFLPSLIAALDTLKIEAISRPASQMLNQVLFAVPQILSAAVILLLTWYVARFASRLLGSLMETAGVDSLPKKMGLQYALAGESRPSKLATWLVMFFAMLFASTEAADQLGFSEVRNLVSTFIRFGGDILLGAAIMVIGFWLSNLAYDAIKKADSTHTAALAGIARVAILGLVLAMGLRAMGIANEIVQMAFGLTFGAIAVAIALSFGLGGREAAGKLMEHWLSRWRKD